MNAKFFGASAFIVSSLIAPTLVSADHVTVKSGDTLWSIANKYKTSVDSIKKLNKLKSDVIYPGQKLSLTSNTNQNNGNTNNSPSETSHTVKSGDTLWALSIKYNVSVNEIKKINNLKNDIIHIGQKIIIDKKGSNVNKPGNNSSQTEDSNTATNNDKGGSVSNEDKTTDITHTVKSGDTLWALANKYKVSVTEIKKMNNLSSDLIITGQKLIISKSNDGTNSGSVNNTNDNQQNIKDYTILYGDSLSMIAFKYNTTVDSIRKLNNIEGSLIYPNQKIKLDLSGIKPIFNKPAEGIITSEFGPRNGRNHNGVDISKSGNVEIKAIADGIVTRSDYSESYGEVIYIEHNISGQIYESVYAHMREDSRLFKTGDTVKAGNTIGMMGNTGNSTGQHLHLEIHKGKWMNGHPNAVNPLFFLK